MTPNDDLARWGEPPATDAEMLLADLLADIMDRKWADQRIPPESLARTVATSTGKELLQVNTWLELMMATVLRHAGLNATIEYPDGTHEIQNFDGPTILIPDEVEAWLRPKLPNAHQAESVRYRQAYASGGDNPASTIDFATERIVASAVWRSRTVCASASATGRPQSTHRSSAAAPVGPTNRCEAQKCRPQCRH